MRNERSYRASRSDSSRASRRESFGSPRSSYVYGSAAPAYSPEAEREFDVIPGSRTRSEVVELPASIMTIARVVVVVAVIIAAIACVRVGLSAMSINTSIATSELSSQIDTARTTGNDLEVMQSQLSNSTHIKLEATGLGMAAPAETTVVALGPDVVATDAQGNLSLSGSLAAIENAG